MSDSERDNSNYDRGDQHEDDDYDFPEDGNKRNQKQSAGDDEKTKVIQNHHYDEAVDVSEGGSEIESDPTPDHNDEQDEEPQISQPQARQIPKQKFEPIRASADSDAGDEDDEKKTAGQYDPTNFAHLDVSAEVKDLFKYITRYRPSQPDPETKLKAFIPDYIPAVGEVDAFLKPSRPDNQTETIGLLTIDEPCLNQTKESTMNLLLDKFRKVPRVEGLKKNVHSIENADKNPKEITKWIQDVSNVQREPPSVVYSKPFKIDDLLQQVWPPEIEDALQGLKLPTEDLDVSLEEYARLCCALLDIPVYQTSNGKNLIESLHVFFTLFDEFKTNQHFPQQREQFVYEGTGAM